jgi:hypothetical protein
MHIRATRARPGSPRFSAGSTAEVKLRCESATEARSRRRNSNYSSDRSPQATRQCRHTAVRSYVRTLHFRTHTGSRPNPTRPPPEEALQYSAHPLSPNLATKTLTRSIDVGYDSYMKYWPAATTFLQTCAVTTVAGAALRCVGRPADI